MRLIVLTLLLALSSLAFAPAPLPKSGRGKSGPNLTIQGTWRQVDKHTTLTVTATRFEYSTKELGPIKYGLRLDATKAPPTYDLLAGGTLNAVGIYKVEGQTLTVCYAPGGSPRPTSFEGDRRHFKEVFIRLK